MVETFGRVIFEDKLNLLNKISNVVSKDNIIVGTSCSLFYMYLLH